VRERLVADRPYTVARIEALRFLLCNTNFLIVKREIDAIWARPCRRNAWGSHGRTVRVSL